MSNKKLVLMRDVICLYHPDFIKSRSLRQHGLNSPEMFNVEYLIEVCLAKLGKYKHIPSGYHSDYSDGSDCKTSSIYVNPILEGGNSHRGEIRGVETSCGGQKIGALRCTIFNPHTDGLMFYYLPKEKWSQHISNSPSGVGTVPYTYYKPDHYIEKFIGYECASFEELARA
jgi:hypothetical protein